METDAHARMPFERGDHRQVRLLVMLLIDPAEVADGLVIVENKPEHDLTHTFSSRFLRDTPSLAPRDAVTAPCVHPRATTPDRTPRAE